MSRLLAIDYGKKRTGIAVSDPLQLIANGLTTVSTAGLFDFLHNYFQKEKVERVIIGLPRQMNYEASETLPEIERIADRLRKRYPEIEVICYDERFTSKMAQQSMIEGGVKRKDRRNKALIDEISATIILQGYMESRAYNEEKERRINL